MVYHVFKEIKNMRKKLKQICRNNEGKIISIKEYDINGNQTSYIIYDENPVLNKVYTWRYDNRNNVIYYKDKQNLKEVFSKYDSHNKLINRVIKEDNNEVEYNYMNTYDKNNRLIHVKCTNGFEAFYKYEDKADNITEVIEYSKNNNILASKIYKDNLLIYKYRINEYEKHYEYDDKGRVIQIIDSMSPLIENIKYEGNKKIYTSNMINHNRITEFDDDGNKIRYRDENNNMSIYEYEYYL